MIDLVICFPSQNRVCLAVSQSPWQSRSSTNIGHILIKAYCIAT